VLVLLGNPFFGVCSFVFGVFGCLESRKEGAAIMEKKIQPSQPLKILSGLKERKELKDIGAISQEEYDEKKKEDFRTLCYICYLISIFG